MKSQEESSALGSKRTERRRTLFDIAFSMAIFSAVGLGAYRAFFVYGKSLMWNPDGPSAHYPSLYFLNLWLRRFLYHPELGLNLWSWTIGFGADVISTLSWGVLGDPFALITLAFPMKYLEYGYAAAFIVRILCAGLFSLLYLRKMGAKQLPALMGSILYVFATFLLVSATRHSFFASAMVFLPLLLIAIENALARRRSWTLVPVVFFAAASNWYFFYMLTIVSVIYAVARYFELAEKADRWRKLLPTALRIAGLYALGGLLAAPLLIPTLVGVMNAARGDAKYARTLLYTIQEYRLIVPAFGSPMVGSYSTYLGFAYLGLVLIPVLYMRPGRGALKFLIPLCAAFVVLPAFGSMFNGFMFPSNRWAFAWGILLALSSALILSDDRRFTRNEILAMSFGFVGYVAAVALLVRPLTAVTVVPMVFGALTIAAFAYERIRAEKPAASSDASPGRIPQRWRSSWVRWAVLGLLVVNVLTNATLIQDPRYQHSVNAFMKRGAVRKMFTKDGGSLVKKLDLPGFYRVRMDAITSNAGLVLKRPGTAMYFSIMSGHLTELKQELFIPGGMSFSFNGLDDRADLLSLVGAKFYLARLDHSQFVPFGYSEYSRNKTSALYRTKMALPLGFVYESVMPRSQYDSLSALDKQSAMLQAAVVDDDALPSLPKVRFESEAIELTSTVKSSEDATLDQATGKLVRTAKKSSVTLSVDPVPGSELYVELKEFDNVIQSPLDRKAEILGKNASAKQIAAFNQSVRDFHQPEKLRIKYSADDHYKTVTWRTPSSTYYWGDRSQLVNLGYFKKAPKTVKITPEGIGTLSFKSLKVYSLPMKEFPKRIGKLKNNPLHDIETVGDTVTGWVDSPKDGVLFLSIPYSTGWSATVDGKPVKLLRVNTAFSGLPITAGKHDVELHYMTPGLQLGLVAAGISAFVLLGMAGLGIARSRRAKQDSE